MLKAHHHLESVLCSCDRNKFSLCKWTALEAVWVRLLWLATLLLELEPTQECPRKSCGNADSGSASSGWGLRFWNTVRSKDVKGKKMVWWMWVSILLPSPHIILPYPSTERTKSSFPGHKPHFFLHWVTILPGHPVVHGRPADTIKLWFETGVLEIRGLLAQVKRRKWEWGRRSDLGRSDMPGIESENRLQGKKRSPFSNSVAEASLNSLITSAIWVWKATRNKNNWTEWSRIQKENGGEEMTWDKTNWVKHPIWELFHAKINPTSKQQKTMGTALLGRSPNA